MYGTSPASGSGSGTGPTGLSGAGLVSRLGSCSPGWVRFGDGSASGAGGVGSVSIGASGAGSSCLWRAGCSITEGWYQELIKDHAIGLDGAADPAEIVPSPEPCFIETVTGSYIPRALLVDTDCDTGNMQMVGPMRKLFSPSNYVLGGSGALKHNYANATYGQHDLLVEVMD